MIRFVRARALLLGSLCGCTGTISGGSAGGDATRDRDPPTIQIDSPERGTITQDASTPVSGRVTDAGAGVAQLTINGEPVELAEDGSFSSWIDLGNGMTLIDTIATDGAGNQSNDARAVLAGTLVPQSTWVSDGIAANVSAHAMEGLRDLVQSLAAGTNFTSIATSLNPVVDTGGGCNSAKVYVESISHGSIEVAMTPVTGGMHAGVTIRDLSVRGHVNFRAVCIGASTSWSISADAFTVSGTIHPFLSSGSIRVSLDGVTSAFSGFDLGVGSVPGFIEDLFQGSVRDRISSILRNQIQSMVPPLVNDFLAEYLADTWDVPVLGETISLAIRPTAMSWTGQGGTIVLDTSATIDSVDSSYLSNPMERPADADMASTGLRVGLADDVVNQMLSAIWASGALDDALLPQEVDQIGAVIGGEVGSGSATMMLPPVADFDTSTGVARITIGDLIIDLSDLSGGPLARFAVSAVIDLAAESTDGKLHVVTRAPQILAQVLDQSPDLLTPLQSDKVVALAEVGLRQFSPVLDELLANLPVPGVPGAMITSPSFQPTSGYVLLGGQIVFP